LARVYTERVARSNAIITITLPSLRNYTEFTSMATVLLAAASAALRGKPEPFHESFTAKF